MLSVIDKAIDFFVKEIHYYYSARPLYGNILIPLNVPQYFKPVLFKIKYRQLCVALHNGLVLQAINIVELNNMHTKINE